MKTKIMEVVMVIEFVESEQQEFDEFFSQMKEVEGKEQGGLKMISIEAKQLNINET